MPELPKPIRDLLAQLGLSQESVQKFSFGGIVGKVTLVALGGLTAAVGVAKYTTGITQIVCVVAVLLVTTLIIRWIFDYAKKNPESATLEGTEIILWQQQRLMLAAKDTTPPKESPVIADPKGTPPQLNPSQGADQ